MTLKITYNDTFPRWALSELGADEQTIDHLQGYVNDVLKYAVGAFEWDVTREVIVKIQKGATYRIRRGRLNGVYGAWKVPCKTTTYGRNRSGFNPADIAKTGGKTEITLNIGSAYYNYYVRMVDEGDMGHKAAMNYLRGQIAETIFHELTHAYQHDTGILTNTCSNRIWYHIWDGQPRVNVNSLSFESYRALPWEVEARSRASSLVKGFAKHRKIHKAKSLTFNELQLILK
ncbi:hypothetical protein MYOV003v1_p0104 [Vibrio phage 207E48.1]|nr:hypothetical protein MYOV003v1_p0104 [Vibrio phage 207E48.1]